MICVTRAQVMPSRRAMILLAALQLFFAAAAVAGLRLGAAGGPAGRPELRSRAARG